MPNKKEKDVTYESLSLPAQFIVDTNQLAED